MKKLKKKKKEICNRVSRAFALETILKTLFFSLSFPNFRLDFLTPLLFYFLCFPRSVSLRSFPLILVYFSYS